jgi:hypothetical protein
MNDIQDMAEEYAEESLACLQVIVMCPEKSAEFLPRAEAHLAAAERLILIAMSL